MALPFSNTTPEPAAPPTPIAPLPTVGKTAYPTALSKNRERPGSAFFETAMVSCASLTSCVTSTVWAAAALVRRPKASKIPTPNAFAAIGLSSPAGYLTILLVVCLRYYERGARRPLRRVPGRALPSGAGRARRGALHPVV